MNLTRFALTALLALVAARMAPGAESPATRPASVSPEVVKRVNDSLNMLADGSDDDKQLAEDRLLNTPIEGLALIEAGLKHPGMDAESRQRLVRVVNHLHEFYKQEQAESARRQADSEWNTASAVEAYDRVGRDGPAWDQAARKGIREFILRAAFDPAAGLDTLHDAVVVLKCDDPLTLYCYARGLEFAAAREPDQAKKAERFANALDTYKAACEGFKKVDYPANRRCLAYARCASMMSKPAQYDAKVRTEAKSLADEALKLFPAAVKVPGISPAHLATICEWIVEAQVQFGADRGATADRMFPVLQQAHSDWPLPLVFKGRQYWKWAWEARGNGYANSVTPEGRDKMDARLAVAEEALTKAYELDPTDSAAATEMLTVELGQGNGRDVMEKWFKRAISANPRDGAAYEAKLNYLQPKWYGSPRDLLGFGHECLATRDWSGNITYFLLRAHILLSTYSKDQTAYWLDPAVWTDVNAVVGRAADIFPDDPEIRTQYAYWAWKCGKWMTANTQFKLLGDKADVSVFNNDPAKLKKARTESAQNAALP